MPRDGAEESHSPGRVTRSPPHRAVEPSARVDSGAERHDFLQRERLPNKIGKRPGREARGLYHRVSSPEFAR
jgi:hypothetical protein